MQPRVIASSVLPQKYLMCGGWSISWITYMTMPSLVQAYVIQIVYISFLSSTWWLILPNLSSSYHIHHTWQAWHRWGRDHWIGYFHLFVFSVIVITLSSFCCSHTTCAQRQSKPNVLRTTGMGCCCSWIEWFVEAEMTHKGAIDCNVCRSLE